MPSKPNAYSLFVRDNFNRLKREGQNPEYSSLFQKLSSQWTSLADAERQKYKDRSKQPGQTWSKDKPAHGSHSNPVSHILLDGTKPPISGTTASNLDSPIGAEAKPQIDVKPIISDLVERKASSKRTHDEIDWDDDDSELMAQNEKKLKLGIPNHWRARQDTPERYSDIHLVKIREKCKAIIASRSSNLISVPIYGFSVNVLCFKKNDNEGGGIYVPIEIGIFAYSIQSGSVGLPYHCLIDAGPPLEGCVNLACDHAEATHKITIPPKQAYPQKARKDYRRIYREIVEYTKAGERTILVWSAREMKQVVGSLEWLYEKACQQPGPGKIPKVSNWTILPAVEFTATMSNFVHQNMLLNKDSVFVIHYYINMLVDLSEFDYDTNLMCNYHKRVETKWCARSCAIRMVLNIERALERIYNGFRTAKSSAFINSRMRLEPLAYHQHRPSEQYLERANRLGTQTHPARHNPDQPQQQDPLLALPAPEQVTSPEAEGNTALMTVEDEPIASDITESALTRPRYFAS